jgi:hypothetical protein
MCMHLTNLDTYLDEKLVSLSVTRHHTFTYIQSQALTDRAARRTFLVQHLQIGLSKDTSHVLRLRTAAIAPLLLRFFLPQICRIALIDLQG